MTADFTGNPQLLHPPPRPLVDPKTKLILFWMHRCGSTTSQRWFFELAGWKDRMQGRGAGELAAMWFAEHARVYDNLPELYRNPEFIKIAVVRNPLWRAVSSYTVVMDSKSGAQWRGVAHALRAPDEQRRITLLEFLDFLEAQDLRAANYHWRLQTAQDWHELQLPDVHIVRLESIRPGLDAVCRMLGKKPVPLRVNSAQSTCRTRIAPSEIVNFTRQDFARAFGRDRRGIIRFPEYGRFMTPQTAERIERLYAPDFLRLGYTRWAPKADGMLSKAAKLMRLR